MGPGHRAVWVAITAAALLAGVGCGRRAAEAADASSKVVDDTAGILSVLTRAGDLSQDLGSAEVRMTTDLGAGQPVAMDGLYTWGDGYAFDVEMDTAAARLQRLQDAPRIRALFVDGVYYYDVDPQPAGPLAGKEWMKVDASAMFGDAGPQAPSESAGPVASLSSLKYADDVEELGKETVGGQRTTHYRAVLDGGSLYDSVTGGADSVTVDVWVGGKELPVRLKQTVGEVTVTMDFVKFGGTAAVQAPPAAQTGDLTEAVEQGGGAQ